MFGSNARPALVETPNLVVSDTLESTGMKEREELPDNESTEYYCAVRRNKVSSKPDPPSTAERFHHQESQVI